ncbi:ISL3 family transposase ISIde1 [uncultured Comamonas sp.]|nr:ISL3 family transposase ISIde1 [uncultured Comamonas sp.]
MGVEVGALFTSALRLVSPWEVVRLRRSWRHLDLFQFEAWLHADVPRVACTGCGKTTRVGVRPWAREGLGFTALFEALALSLCSELSVRQAGALLRCADKPLWRCIQFYVKQARALDDMSAVRTVGIDETSVRRRQHYITVVHDLDAKRLLLATEGRDHRTVLDFVDGLKRHGGDPAAIAHVCQGMSAAYTEGVGMALPNAAISYERFHVVKMAIEAMDGVRRSEWREQPRAVTSALGGKDKKVLKGLMWGMRKNPSGRSSAQTHVMHWLQHSTSKAVRAWRLKMALREVYGAALEHNDSVRAQADLRAWLSGARRERLESFKKLAKILTVHFDGGGKGMLGNRSNSFVEAMNGLLQQAKRAARDFRTTRNFIAISYLRMSKLAHLPDHPFTSTAAK